MARIKPAPGISLNVPRICEVAPERLAHILHYSKMCDTKQQAIWAERSEAAYSLLREVPPLRINKIAKVQGCALAFFYTQFISNFLWFLAQSSKYKSIRF